MAYREDETLKKLNIFARILLCAKFLRFVFFFYAFLSFVFWFLNCFEVEWLYLFNWLFSFPYQIVRLFYTPQGISADFSLAIIGGITLFMGFGLDFITNLLYQRVVALQEEEEKNLEKRRMMRQKQKRKAARPVADYNPDEQKAKSPFENSKLLFLILAEVKKIKRKKEDIDLTFQEIEIWKQRVNKKLIANMNYSNPMQKGYYRKHLFLLYNEFNYVDDFIEHILPTLDSIVIEFKRYGIMVRFCYVMSAITEISGLEKELDCMDTTLSLNFENEFIVTNRFKVTYDNKTIKKYKLTYKGEYNLSKNLSISNRQPLYTLESGNTKGE